MYRSILTAALGAAAFLSVAPAQAATYFGPADMKTSTAADGTMSTSFGQSGITAGNFTHIYQFTLPENGKASGSIITSAVTFEGPTDLDLTSVFFNGVKLTGLFGGGVNEFVFANAVPIKAGVLNEITINGFSRGNGSYGGQGVFAPAGVPEPAAWGMMIGGFALAGGALRRTRRTRVTYANA
ncbi:FxDxF family PEP-CTERM protein [Sphingomonas azotifigens]|uniref:FxDxF family PEP-CTERM protein n=1 Tax=Sphingomonas azotifigens TaxID=330920 RepID=UPI000A0071FC|nr:FxDxF family PEP-CTERM protein [Sphingomonas azotifigens]